MFGLLVTTTDGSKCREVVHLRQGQHPGVKAAPNPSTSSYPGWMKSPHVVTLGILKFSGGEGYIGVNFGHPKSEVVRNGGGDIPE